MSRLFIHIINSLFLQIGHSSIIVFYIHWPSIQRYPISLIFSEHNLYKEKTKSNKNLNLVLDTIRVLLDRIFQDSNPNLIRINFFHLTRTKEKINPYSNHLHLVELTGFTQLQNTCRSYQFHAHVSLSVAISSFGQVYPLAGSVKIQSKTPKQKNPTSSFELVYAFGRLSQKCIQITKTMNRLGSF